MKLLSPLLALLAPLSASADVVALPAYLDAGTNLVMGLNVEAALASPLVAQALEKAQASAPEAASAWTDRLLRTGLPLVREVYVTATVQPGKQDDAADAGFVWLRGDFSTGGFRDSFCSAGCDSFEHHGLQYVEATEAGAETKPALLAVSDALLAISSRPRIESLAERISANDTAAAREGLLRWVDSLRSHHLWLAALGPFEAPEAEAGALPMGGEMISQLDGFGLGVTIDDPLRLGLEVRAISEPDAESLYNLASGLLTMAKMNAAESERPTGPNFLDEFEMTLDGASIRGALSLPQAMLEQYASEWRPQPSQAEPGETAPAVRPAAQRPAKSGKIMIHGLGLEPREVSVGP